MTGSSVRPRSSCQCSQQGRNQPHPETDLTPLSSRPKKKLGADAGEGSLTGPSREVGPQGGRTGEAWGRGARTEQAGGRARAPPHAPLQGLWVRLGPGLGGSSPWLPRDRTVLRWTDPWPLRGEASFPLHRSRLRWEPRRPASAALGLALPANTHGSAVCLSAQLGVFPSHQGPQPGPQRAGQGSGRGEGPRVRPHLPDGV